MQHDNGHLQIQRVVDIPSRGSGTESVRTSCTFHTEDVLNFKQCFFDTCSSERGKNIQPTTYYVGVHGCPNVFVYLTNVLSVIYWDPQAALTVS